MTDLQAAVERLESCPFCGGKPVKRLGVGEWWVSCPACESSSRASSNYEAAIVAWNRRSAVSRVPGREEIEQAIWREVVPDWSFDNEGRVSAFLRNISVDRAVDAILALYPKAPETQGT